MQGRDGRAGRRGGGPSAATPVNYNELMLQGSTPPAHSPGTPSDYTPTAGALSRRVGNPGSDAHAAPSRLVKDTARTPANAPALTSSGHLVTRGSDGRPSSSFRSSLERSSEKSGSPGAVGPHALPMMTGFLEGPLPPEVRQLIDSSCHAQGQPRSVQEEAERQARRLLSTNRRIKVYREELQAAMAESSDLEGVLERQRYVTDALRGEMTDIDAQIARLLQEKQLCEAQLAHELQTEEHQANKLTEARERVAVLRNTVDNIANESHRGYLMLRQIVPNLNIDNYT